MDTIVSLKRLVLDIQQHFTFVVPRLGQNTLYSRPLHSELRTLTDSNKLQHTLSIVHANYVIPVCITSHSFSRFYALALASYTLQHYSCFFFFYQKLMKKIEFCYQNYGLTPWQKSDFLVL